MAEKKDIVLSTKDLSIGYRSRTENNIIATDLNLNLYRGEMVSLMGINGIGKSTLLRTITGVQKELSGKILIQDKDLKHLPPNEIAKKISVVLTERIPSNNLTVYELIALGRQPYTNWLGSLSGKDKEQISFAIEQTGLKDLLNKRCDALSDGQLQRVMICRALAQNTEIIFLDEPTAHLDIQHKIEIFKILAELAHKLGKSILISTHEIQFGLQMSDKLWLMTRDGILSGTPDEMIQSNNINKIFDTDQIKFDKDYRQFRII
jgi:iron complex transport system ATP-binding protein